MSELIFIKCKNPFVPTCAEISPHLEAYWTQPGRFALQSLVLIELHLVEYKCLPCLRKFEQIRRRHGMPWKKSPKRKEQGS